MAKALKPKKPPKPKRDRQFRGHANRGFARQLPHARKIPRIRHMRVNKPPKARTSVMVRAKRAATRHNQIRHPLARRHPPRH